MSTSTPPTSQAAAGRPKVLVARKTFDDIVDRLRPHFEVESNDTDLPWPQDELIRRLQGKAGVYISGSDKIDVKLLDACPDLRVVCTMAVGYNNIDVAACSERGVLVTNAPDVLTETTADFGFALMMATARRITESEHFLRAGRWQHWSVTLFAGADIHGATLGVLGMGRIGAAIARRGHLGFGMPVIYHNRSRLPADQEGPLGAQWVEKDELLRRADHLVIVVPYSASSHHLIGQRELRLMKPTATLVNIARGGVVDDAALAAELKAGTIAAAGLDVFEGEPTVHPALLDCENVVLTPHIASATVATRRAMSALAVDNLILALTGGTAKTPLNAGQLRAR
ncbi:2-hydroxyacid dehydrogenase [Roseateles amylovorans]|uniref:D-glycerate dehydrogenase n=1 Tax=Roseateles amylovorans TaxID=2978473 RepID=A0ABY6B2R4_9BURK|nr:D-glycerate dehydrogenase [Roseateles amylovorans]UXH79479.1 D-glycerate dehydrogenase [Roseateles amylovorans]